MKIIILSDSHSMTKSTLSNFITNHPADYYLHCGDLYMPYTPLDINNFYNVRGNNDYGEIEITKTFKIDNLKFFMCHGHTFNIDETTSDLEKYAFNNQIDVVCFGHSHCPTYYQKNNVIFINPGSLTYPRGTYRQATYCIFDTISKEVVFYNYKDDAVCDPFTPIKKESFFKRFFK